MRCAEQVALIRKNKKYKQRFGWELLKEAITLDIRHIWEERNCEYVS
jgi:hypothetical protein